MLNGYPPEYASFQIEDLFFDTMTLINLPIHDILLVQFLFSFSLDIFGKL